MKNYITVLLTMLTFGFIYAQEGVEVPLRTSVFDIQNGTYIKDIDDVFSPYIGTWRGIWGGKEIILKIEKSTKQLNTSFNGDYHYDDRLVIKYKVTDSHTGVVITNNIDNPNPEEAKISNTGTGKNNRMRFIYSDDELCYNTGIIILVRDLSNPNKLTYKYFYESFWIPEAEDCNYTKQSDIPIYIPTVNVVFTKM